MISLPRSIAGFLPFNTGRSVLFRLASVRFSSNDVVPQEKNEELMDEAAMKAAELETKRNKSRLKEKHYNIVHGKIPVDIKNPTAAYQETLKFQRKLAAKHGTESGINLGICWPTKLELDDMLEYESVAYPYTVQEVMQKKHSEREEQKKKLVAREKEIELKVSKLSIWMKELEDRKAKKLAAAREAQEKKDRLIEEVRQHFGYVVNMKDPKFQEMLELKEKEQKKAEKDQKKKERYEKASEKAKQYAENLEKQALEKSA